jgi:ABC-type multidrug transport system permease subunit
MGCALHQVQQMGQFVFRMWLLAWSASHHYKCMMVTVGLSLLCSHLIEVQLHQAQTVPLMYGMWFWARRQFHNAKVIQALSTDSWMLACMYFSPISYIYDYQHWIHDIWPLFGVEIPAQRGLMYYYLGLEPGTLKVYKYSYVTLGT